MNPSNIRRNRIAECYLLLLEAAEKKPRRIQFPRPTPARQPRHSKPIKMVAHLKWDDIQLKLKCSDSTIKPLYTRGGKREIQSLWNWP